MESTIINGEEYFWCEINLDDFDEFLGVGYEFSFRYRNTNYSVEGASFDVDARESGNCPMATNH